jgi:putative MATE family efflux protein
VAGDPLVAALGGRGRIAVEAGIYLRISLLGVPALLVSLAGVGYLRGLRDTRTPFVVAALTAVGNGVLEWVLIFGLGFGIGASALSTVLAQTGAAIVFVHRVLRSSRRWGVGLRPDPRAIGRLVTVGFHLLVRTAALRGSLVVGVAVAARIGTPELAAYEIGFQIWSLAALTLDAVAIAAQAMVGHELGAGRDPTARLIARRALWWATVVGAVMGAVIAVASPWLPALFTADPAVRDLAAVSFLFVAAAQPLNGAVFALDGILIGAGDQRFLAWAMVVAFALYVPAAVAVGATGAGLGWLWTALAVFMAARGAVLGLRLTGDKWTVTGAVR